jgi:DNA-directed RNA polymerase specialized sigma24 family protein
VPAPDTTGCFARGGWGEFDDVSARLDLAPAIDGALAKIPEPFRSTLIIVDVEDQSYEAAAEALGVPIGTVRSRLFRGRRLMQEQLRSFAADAGLVRAITQPLPEASVA